MTLRVSGKNMDVGDALRSRAEAHFDSVVKKYFDGGYTGHLTLEPEGPGFNVFAAKDGKLTTPAHSVLPGITRQTVFDICAMLGTSVSIHDISPNALIMADEVFITSTAGGIMPVSSVNRTTIGNGTPGPLTTRIKNKYWDMHTNPAWSTAVTYA